MNKYLACFLLLSISLHINPEGQLQPGQNSSYTQPSFNTQEHKQSKITPFFTCEQSVNNYSGIQSEKDLKNLVIKAIAWNYYCRVVYHMSSKRYQDLLRCNHEDFVWKILLDDQLSDQAILELFSAYKRKHFIRIFSNSKIEKKIQEALFERKIKKQDAQKQNAQKQNAQKQENIALRLKTQKEKVQDHFASCGLDYEKCVYLPEDFTQVQAQYQCVDQWFQKMDKEDDALLYQQRLAALKKTYDQNFMQSEKIILFSEQTSGYLMAHDINPEQYRLCYGTALQQQFHEEICHNFDSIAQVQQNYLYQPLCFTTSLQCNDVAYWSNQGEVLFLTVPFLDLSKACFNFGKWILKNGQIYGQAIVEGVCQSAHEFVHMVCHPAEMIQGLCQVTWFAMETIALQNPSLLLKYPEIFEPLKNERNALISSLVGQGFDYLAKSSGPERVKMITKFSADCILQHKAMQALGAVAGILRTQIKTAQTMEYVADVIGHESEFALAAQEVAQVTEELEKFFLQDAMQPGSLIEKAGVAALESTILTRSLAEIIADIQKLGGKIPLSNVELCLEVKEIIKQILKETNLILDREFKQQFASKWVMENGIKKRVVLDLEHVLNYEVKFKNNKIFGFLEVEFSGGHLAGSTEALAKKGLIKIVDKKVLTNGCVKYKVQDVFTKKPFTKTEFHISWNKEKIVEHSWDLFKNPSIEEYATRDQKIAKYIEYGKQKLSIVMKKHEKDINIVTSVPYKVKKKII